MSTVARRLREAEARKQQILKAAWKCFLKKGISGTTMDEIAGASELGKGTLYIYFSGKEEIAFALLIRATEDLLKTLQAALDPGISPRNQIRRFALAYYDFFISQPEAFRYMFVIPHDSYTGKISEELVNQWGNTGRTALAMLTGLLEKGKAEGDFEFQEAWPTAIALWSALTGVIAICSQDVRRPFLGDLELGKTVMQAVDLLLNGLRPTNYDRSK